MRSGRMLVVLSVVTLLVGGCSDDSKKEEAATTTTAATAPSGPQTYSVIVDGPSTLGAENLVYGTYFPSEIKVRPGDTIAYENRSSNDIHTVTFGINDDRSNQPLTVTPEGQANKYVFGPCFSVTPVQREVITCQGDGTPPEWSGKGWWNSGVIMPTSLPPEAGPKKTSVKLGADIARGSFRMVCLLHPNMSQVLTVVGSDAERQSPAQVAAADRELGDYVKQAASIVVPNREAATDVVAGWSNKLIAVNRFSPETISVKVGQTVRWKTASEWMPHTVSFQPPFQSPAEKNALLPTGVKSGGTFAGGVSHSGIFGPPPDGKTTTFSLSFTKAGKYPYLCLLHPGMAGTVEVS